MPKKVSAADLQPVLDLISRHPDGVGIDMLQGQINPAMPRRTLQRRLAELVAQGHVRKEGEARALKYRLAGVKEASDLEFPAFEVSGFGEAYIPLTSDSASVRDYVRQPRQQRKPVGYQIGFLERYHPNETHYLPGTLRTQLHHMGRSPATQAAAGTFARDILNRLLIDLAWASSRLEGNTYSRLDTERLIEFGQAAEGKDALETQMILNHKAAIEYLVREVERTDVSEETVIALHAFLSDGLMPDPLTCGRLRSRSVEIGGSVYLPIALPQRLEELFGIVMRIAAEIVDPFEQAFFLMVHLPYLQPFEDVNKRVSRLAANIPLIRQNLCPLSFIDVPQQAYIDGILGVYELNDVALLRDVFVWAYERSCQQYVAVQQQLAPPDTFRLRYRQQLTATVAAIIRGGLAVSEASIRSVMPREVLEDDQARFVALALTEFATIHSGNAIRFGLRPLEFSAWLEQQSDRP